MKYHKIRNVPLTTCTAEQKIAYNLASKYYTYKKTEYDIQAVGSFKNDVVHEFVELCMNLYSNSKHYDIDAVFCALNSGAEKYLKAPFIATSYEQIGKCFKANYLKAE